MAYSKTITIGPGKRNGELDMRGFDLTGKSQQR